MKKYNKIHDVMKNIREDKTKNFELFYKQCKEYVYKISYSIIKNKADAEDIMQNVFTKIYKIDADFLPDKNEASWLYTVTKNETFNYLKSRKDNINIEELQIFKEDEGMRKLINESDYKSLLKKLNSEDELIVKLKIESDFTFKEIASILGKNENTVKWKYYSALHFLRIFLTNLCLLITSNRILYTMDKKVDNSEENQIENNNLVIQNVITAENSQESSQEIENDNTIIENTIEMTEKQEENSYKNIKIPVYVVSVIFLLFTVIFFIKFILYQLKHIYKLSK